MILGVDGRLANEEQRAGGRRLLPRGAARVAAGGAGAAPARLSRCAAARPHFPELEAELAVLPPRRFWTHRALARELRANPPDVFWSPVTQTPLGAACPCMATVHDLAFLTFPDQFTWRKRTEATLQARYAARRAAHFIADSECTRADLQRLLGVPPEKISVGLLGCAEVFAPQPPEAIAAALEEHQVPAPYVIYVGRLQPRKNIVRLIEAFGMVMQRRPELPHCLVLAGHDGWMCRTHP